MDEFDTIVEIISEFLGEPKKVYENTWVNNISSAGIHLASVAGGQADVFIGPKQKARELGAGYLLVNEGGGIVTDFNGEEIGNKEFNFNKTYKIIASGTKELGEKIMHLI